MVVISVPCLSMGPNAEPFGSDKGTETMTLEQIIRNRKGRAGSDGSWHVRHEGADCDGNPMFALFHYSTAMLVWSDVNAGQSDAHARIIDTSTGHGSVSDQNGMNKAFRTLGLDLYYSRKGGAEIR